GTREVSLLELHRNALTGGEAPAITIAETVAGVTATARGAASGAELIDRSTRKTYQNIGTPNAPDWVLVGDEGLRDSAVLDLQTQVEALDDQLNPSTLGPELLANPDFDGNADGWVLGSNVAYTDHAVVVDMSSSQDDGETY